MRTKKAAFNFAAAIIELVVVTVTSFIVPHYMIHAYGSDVNGLISSIKQFLSYIALVESGIGAIGRASLYKPLANGDHAMLSGNVRAIDGFYKKISYLFLGYMAILAVLFPLIVKDFDWAFSATLVLILAMSTFIKYYFGITNQTLIQADQKKYIPSLLHSFTLILNALITMLLVDAGCGVHVVKIGSALAYAIRPFALFLYARRHYKLDRKAEPRKEILKQRWDGLAQHIAFFIHKNTDIAVLTVLTNVKEVSVYSVYNLAVAGCAKVVNTFSSSLEPAFGNMIAKGEKETLKSRVSMCSTLTVQVSVALFSTAAIVISPFVTIYTKGVTDVEYLRPAFGIIMLIAEAIYCIRLPYQSTVYAAGHFKQTRNGAIAEAVLNIVISVILVFNFGLIGVAVGTLVSMTFRTIQYIWYYHIKLLGEKDGIGFEIKRTIVALAEIAIYIGVAKLAPQMELNNYFTWFLYSSVVGIVCVLIMLLFSYVFFKKQLIGVIRIIMHLIKKRTKKPQAPPSEA